MPALFDSEAAATRIAEAFDGAVDPTAFSRAGRSALGALIAYVRDTQKGAPLALRLPAAEDVSAHMRIDAATRASLELLVTQRGERKGSLLSRDRSLRDAAPARGCWRGGWRRR